MRASGVLMPVSSLPSRFGIGCFSKEAYEFVDFLISAGQKYWQILPLGPTTYGDSPYQSYSTFAGNPNYIDLEVLIRDGLLTEEEVASMDWGDREDYVDYTKVQASRAKVLRMAFERYDLQRDGEYGAFVRENGFWLEDYCLYMAIKEDQEGAEWNQWPEGLRNRHPGALQECRERLEDTISFYRFRQYLFHKHWYWLKNYANQNGVKIIGDLPIYVAFDSADTWANPLLFQFDEKSRWQWPDARRTAFPRTGSSGEILSTAGSITVRPNTAGGCSGFPTACPSTIWYGSIISVDLTSIIPFPTGIRRPSMAIGRKGRGSSSSVSSKRNWGMCR